ncbi:berghepain-1-like [Anticarsia gemmatalis]|uniref:berghepain-1-like n=1 Tax=Anticarsia gemmatalis TaxID=129554 RepID=UPI003F766A05
MVKIYVSLVLFVVAVAMATDAEEAGTASPRFYDLKDAPQLFEKFIKDHNRKYKDDADRQVHYEAFLNTLQKINKDNAAKPAITHEINGFADFTQAEYRNFFRAIDDDRE